MPDIVPPHRVEQTERVADVVAVIKGRLAHRFADLDQRCEMHDAVEAMRAEDRFERWCVAEVGLHELPAEDRFAVSRRKVIEHDHGVPALEKDLHHVRADVARAPDDQHLQSHLLHDGPGDGNRSKMRAAR